jgi:hypothetical protein
MTRSRTATMTTRPRGAPATTKRRTTTRSSIWTGSSRGWPPFRGRAGRTPSRSTDKSSSNPTTRGGLHHRHHPLPTKVRSESERPQRIQGARKRRRTNPTPPSEESRTWPTIFLRSSNSRSSCCPMTTTQEAAKMGCLCRPYSRRGRTRRGPTMMMMTKTTTAGAMPIEGSPSCCARGRPRKSSRSRTGWPSSPGTGGTSSSDRARTW